MNYCRLIITAPVAKRVKVMCSQTSVCQTLRGLPWEGGGLPWEAAYPEIRDSRFRCAL